ncbi:hypothetical protein D3C76_1824930 [compost metagenome]
MHADASVGASFADGVGTVGSVDAVMGFGKTHPENAEGAAWIGLFVDDFKKPFGRSGSNRANANRV